MKADFEINKFTRMVNVIPETPDSFHLHWHKYVEVIFLKKEAVDSIHIIKIANKDYVLKPGDILLIWPGEMHEIIKNTPHEIIGIQFYPEVINNLHDFLPFSSYFRSFRILHDSETNEYREKMYSLLIKMLDNRSLTSFSDLETYIDLLRFFENYSYYIEGKFNLGHIATTTDARKTMAKISLACNYISGNCDQDISLDDVANYVGFSTTYLSRTFKTALGMPYTSYISLQRIKLAQSLLADPDMSITDVAYQSGFKSIATFNRVFKQQKGYSPREYRKYYLV